MKLLQWRKNSDQDDDLVVASHSGSKWLKPAKNKFTQSDFTSFSIQIPAYSNSFRFRSLRVSYQKFVKSLQEQVWSVIFTNFLNLIFGGNFEFDPTVRKLLKIITNDIAIIAEVHSLVVCRLPYPMVCWVSSEKRKQEAWNGIEKYA